MGNWFYTKLALTNIRRNAQTYIPYILTSIGTIMMFQIIGSITFNSGLKKLKGGSSLSQMLLFGTIVVGLFSLIFLFYTNSFLVKRRKKEFGLLNILGMEKRHLAKIMFLETFFVGAFSIIMGILGGALLSKLMFLLLLKILNFEVQMGFEVSVRFMFVTAILFTGIFFLSLINNLRHVHIAKPIELIEGGHVGEREPKTKWLILIIGLVTLGWGYYIALTTESPLSALQLFFGAVVLVIIGTYCLFTAGSIWLLKMLRKNKKFYYQPQHFSNISGMIYRMKQNAVGLANICILSTMVLVVLSTTVSLYIGMEDVLRTRYPRDFILTTYKANNTIIQNVNDAVNKVLSDYDRTASNIVEYRYLAFTAKKIGDHFSTDRDDKGIFSTAIQQLYFIPVEDYNKLSGRSVVLKENEALIFSNREQYLFDSLSVLDQKFIIKERLDFFIGDGSDAMNIVDSHFLIVKDMDVVQRMYEGQLKVYGDYASDIAYYLGFDLATNREEGTAIYKDLGTLTRQSLNSSTAHIWVESLEYSRDEFYSLYGGLFFLGIFLGILFIGATVLIIYYKQITEGYDDKQRFEIMQKVGMSRLEVKRTIRAQVLMVFFLPLLTAVIHIAFAFKVITKMLALFNLMDVSLFAWCTVGVILVFAVFYAIVYALTARVYYRIVSE